MATISEVARHAAVSVATVSHVVNDSRYVSPETKKRVKAAIEALNYRPHGIARSLRKSKTATIGIMISDISNQYFADVVRGVESILYQADDRYNYILCNTEEDSKRERLYFDVLLEKRIDGLIISPAGGNSDYVARLIGEGMPIVCVDRSFQGVDADTIGVDNREAARKLVAHLIGLGHRRIVALRANINANTIDERIEGYRDALAASGLSYDPSDVAHSLSDIDSACEVGHALLTPRPLPDAVFCTNNFMTLGMMRAIAEAGFACPRDIAVAGVDDFSWTTGFLPRLTAVAQPAHAIGREAALVLLDRIAKRRTGPAIKLVLPTELHIRDSCGAGLTASGRTPDLADGPRG